MPADVGVAKNDLCFAAAFLSGCDLGHAACVIAFILRLLLKVNVFEAVWVAVVLFPEVGWEITDWGLVELPADLSVVVY